VIASITQLARYWIPTSTDSDLVIGSRAFSPAHVQ
jgi:hypothetical protein